MTLNGETRLRLLAIALLIVFIALFISIPALFISIPRVSRSMVHTALNLIGICLAFSVIAWNYYSRRQARLSEVLLEVKPGPSAALAITFGIVIALFGIGTVFGDLLLGRSIELLAALKAVMLIVAGWLWFVMGQNPAVFTEEGVFLGVRFTRWHDIESYEIHPGRNNARLELRTKRAFPLLNSIQADLNPQGTDAIRKILQEKMISRSSI